MAHRAIERPALALGRKDTHLSRFRVELHFRRTLLTCTELVAVTHSPGHVVEVSSTRALICSGIARRRVDVVQHDGFVERRAIVTPERVPMFLFFLQLGSAQSRRTLPLPRCRVGSLFLLDHAAARLWKRRRAVHTVKRPETGSCGLCRLARSTGRRRPRHVEPRRCVSQGLTVAAAPVSYCRGGPLLFLSHNQVARSRGRRGGNLAREGSSGGPRRPHRPRAAPDGGHAGVYCSTRGRTSAQGPTPRIRPEKKREREREREREAPVRGGLGETTAGSSKIPARSLGGWCACGGVCRKSNGNKREEEISV